MSDRPTEGKPADPLEQWRVLRDVYMDAWAKAMGEAVNSEAYTQASGAVLDTCLTASSPLRDAQKKAMTTALEQLNMPSRAEFVSLAQRLSNIELLLDDMSAKLDEVHRAVTTSVQPTAPQAKSETPKAAAQPITQPITQPMPISTQPVVEVKHTQPIAEFKPEAKAAAQTVSQSKPEIKAAAQPVFEAKSETKSAVRREAVKSAKKGSR
jgi:Poly(R)-hydroxyalkanoic acid synthase subunit (PHA_synth_III_E)